MTLTWNFKNGLAEPNIVPGTDDMWPRPANTTGGLTEKGLEFVEEMQRLHMLVDVSHLSDAGIWDILRVAKRPFVASHSNARACCPHVRNLTDEMLTAMGEKGCLIGLNYCASFLDTNPDRSQVRSRITDMARHARYIMAVSYTHLIACHILVVLAGQICTMMQYIRRRLCALEPPPTGSPAALLCMKPSCGWIIWTIVFDFLRISAL